MTISRLFILALLGAQSTAFVPTATAQAPRRPRAAEANPTAAAEAYPTYPAGQPTYPPGQPAYPPTYPAGQPTYPASQPTYPPGPPAPSPEPSGYPPAPELVDDGSISEPQPPQPAPQPEPAPAPEPEKPVAVGPSPNSYEGKIAASPYRRTGFVFGGGIGTRFCLTSYCRPDPGLGVGPGFQARLLFEYRFIQYLSAGLTFGFAYHKILRAGIGNDDPLTTYKEHGFGWNLLATVTAYPLPFSRFDPYVGLGIGFAQQREKSVVVSSGTSSATQQWHNRGVLRLTFGLDIFATPKFSLGPRLDLDRGFGGNSCDDASAVAKSCMRFQQEDQDIFPRWISVMMDFKGHF